MVCGRASFVAVPVDLKECDTVIAKLVEVVILDGHFVDLLAR